MAMKRHAQKDGSTSYSAVYFNPEGRRTVEHVRTVKPGASERDHEQAATAARAKADTQRRAVKNRDWRDPRADKPKRVTFGKLVALFLEGYRSRAGRILYYEQRAKAWLSFFDAKKPADAITPADVERFRNARSATLSRGRRVSAATVRHDLISLGTLYTWAVTAGHVTNNPASAARVRRPSVLRKQRGYLSDEQERDLLARCAPWLSRIVRWAIGTGMDRGEVLALTWAEVDEHAGVVHAPRLKTGVARDVPLNETLRGILREARAVRSLTSGGLVFLDAKGGPVHERTLQSALARAYAAAGFTVAGPCKIFRHTFGSRLAMAGHSAQSIARLMGHSTPAITDTYMHLSPLHLRDVMATLDRPADLHHGLHHEEPAAVTTEKKVG